MKKEMRFFLEAIFILIITFQHMFRDHRNRKTSKKLSDHLLMFPKGCVIDISVKTILYSTTVSHELKDN